MLWKILFVVLVGVVFALSTFWKVDVLDSRAVKGIVMSFLLGVYWTIVFLGTSEKKRTLSHATQIFLGVLLAITYAVILDASPGGFALAIILGLILGYYADKWVEYVSLP